jgi:predicted RND superfamily exporter protein
MLGYQLTGGPVFNAEIGSGMEKDMRGTITLTSLLIAGLFLLMQRDFKQLLLICVLLALTFFITLGLAGWLIGSLNLVSVGFAAILLGLVIDYAVVIAREAHGEPAVALRKMVAPSILWAAVSTAIVFGVLMMSTFTGVQQLGALVMLGLLSGAVVMLMITPWYFEKFPSKPVCRMMTPMFLSSRLALWALPVVVMTALMVLGFKGAPRVSFDLNMVEPEASEAAQAFEKIQQKFSSWSDQNVILLASSDSLDDLKLRAEAGRDELERLREEGVILSAQWPGGLIPNPEYYQKNRDAFKRLQRHGGNALTLAKSAGFSEDGLALDRGVMEALRRLESPSSERDWLDACAGDALIGLFFDRNDAGRGNGGCTYYMAGRMLTAESVTTRGVEKFVGLERCGVHSTGWSMLQAILLPHVKRDFYVIFIPAAFVLLVVLMFVFRCWKDAMISVLVLGSSLVSINALVVLTGQPWNFLSGMAIPLIVGAGIDYSIHLIFALRRFDGDWVSVWNGVGKAICFCGTSTAIGFSSLLFASNEMLRSMGMLCSMGVFSTMVLSLLVIPGLWKWSRNGKVKIS